MRAGCRCGLRATRPAAKAAAARRRQSRSKSGRKVLPVAFFLPRLHLHCQAVAHAGRKSAHVARYVAHTAAVCSTPRPDRHLSGRQCPAAPHRTSPLPRLALRPAPTRGARTRDRPSSIPPCGRGALARPLRPPRPPASRRVRTTHVGARLNCSAEDPPRTGRRAVVFGTPRRTSGRSRTGTAPRSTGTAARPRCPAPLPPPAL